MGQAGGANLKKEHPRKEKELCAIGLQILGSAMAI